MRNIKLVFASLFSWSILILSTFSELCLHSRGEAAIDRTGVSMPSLAASQQTTTAIRMASTLGRSKCDQRLTPIIPLIYALFGSDKYWLLVSLFVLLLFFMRDKTFNFMLHIVAWNSIMVKATTVPPGPAKFSEPIDSSRRQHQQQYRGFFSTKQVRPTSKRYVQPVRENIEVVG